MLSNKKIEYPLNLINLAKLKGPIKAGIVCAGNSLSMDSALEATKLSMKRAVDKFNLKNASLIIDGNFSIKYKNYKEHSIIKGEQVSFSIAAASIIAKQTRELEIEKLKEEIGDFGSGYPSDTRTIKFLKSFYADNGKWPTGTRKSWKTVERIRPVKTLDDFGEK